MINLKIMTRIIPSLLFGGLLIGCRPNPVIPSPIQSTSTTYTLETITPTSTTAPIDLTTTPSSTITAPRTVVAMTETPTPSKALLQLTYVSNQHDGPSMIFAVDIYCFRSDPVCLGKPKLLFEWKDWISGIDWSPDGKKVAFSSGFGRSVLYIADWNGENAEEITALCGTANWPKWSPDGSKVAFIYAEGKDDCSLLDYFRINVYDIAHGQISTILSSAFYPSRIFWLPGGEFAYISQKSKTDVTKIINIVETDGTITHELPTNAVNYTNLLDFTFSPDGRKVAFVIEISLITRLTTDDIYVIDRESSYITNLTQELGINLAPAWSPQEDWIAFISDRTGDWDIYLIRSDGSELINVTQNQADETDPAWRRLTIP